MDLDLTIIGWIHGVACTVALVSLVPVLVRRKGSAFHRRWGLVFTISYALACLTALGIYRLNMFWFPHWLAVAGLVVIAIGWLAARFKFWGWRYIHITAMMLSAYNLIGGLINEAFLRVSFLHDMVGDDFLSNPMVGRAHMLNMLFFIALIIAYSIASAVSRPRRKTRQPVLSGVQS